MAEVFGIVAGVASLLPLCSEGFGLMKDIFEASTADQIATNRVQLQRDQYVQWTKIWASADGKATRFALFAKHDPAAARSMLFQLGLLSKSLFDAKELQSNYGLKANKQFKQEGLEDLCLDAWNQAGTEAAQYMFIQRCKSNMSFMNKCKFVMKKDDKRWDQLIELLKEYNCNLRTFGPQDELFKMQRREFELLVKLPIQKLLAKFEASEYEGRRASTGPKRAVAYQEIARAAKFRAAVVHDMGRVKPRYFTMSDFRFDKNWLLSMSEMKPPIWFPDQSLSSQATTMAIFFDYPMRGQRRVVLVEWMQDEFPVQTKKIEAKASMLCTRRPDQLLIPTCYGIVKDPVNLRSGLIFAPPDHIRKDLPKIMPSGSISQQRMPVSLRELLRRGRSSRDTLDLGIRFELAKKLVDAVHMMHCVGWVHKNIRPGSILFFPAKVVSPHDSAQREPPALSYDHPLFLGFGNTRADDTVIDSGGDEVDRRKPTKSPGDIDMDYYQHPEKRRSRNVRYSRCYNIYSLGCVLLEIGRWKPLDSIADPKADAEEFKWQLQDYAGRIKGFTGSIYAGVVERCLSVDTDADDNALSELCLEIAAELDKCVA